MLTKKINKKNILNSKIKPETRLKANSFIKELCKYETILTVIKSIEVRFVKHKDLYADFNCLDPNNFYTGENVLKDALKSIYTKMLPFVSNSS